MNFSWWWSSSIKGQKKKWSSSPLEGHLASSLFVTWHLSFTTIKKALMGLSDEFGNPTLLKTLTYQHIEKNIRDNTKIMSINNFSIWYVAWLLSTSLLGKKNCYMVSKVSLMMIYCALKWTLINAVRFFMAQLHHAKTHHHKNTHVGGIISLIYDHLGLNVTGDQQLKALDLVRLQKNKGMTLHHTIYLSSSPGGYIRLSNAVKMSLEKFSP